MLFKGREVKRRYRFGVEYFLKLTLEQVYKLGYEVIFTKKEDK